MNMVEGEKPLRCSSLLADILHSCLKSYSVLGSWLPLQEGKGKEELPVEDWGARCFSVVCVPHIPSGIRQTQMKAFGRALAHQLRAGCPVRKNTSFRMMYGAYAGSDCSKTGPLGQAQSLFPF